jgi:hypothetical protein
VAVTTSVVGDKDVILVTRLEIVEKYVRSEKATDVGRLWVIIVAESAVWTVRGSVLSLR